MSARFLLALLLALPPLTLAAAPDLRAEFWLDLDGVQREGEESPLPDREAALRLLEEASWVFAGMIDGFEFEWTPENKGRAVAEAFSLKPLSVVKAGDPRLRPGEARRDPRRFSAWVEFRPDAADLLALEAGSSATWKSAQGRGQADWQKGWPGRREAYIAALKAGIEDWARANLGLRPRLLRGRVVFAAPPSMAIVDGAYTVQARLRIEVLEVRKWEIW